MRKQPEPVTRDNILSILSDDEAARVALPAAAAQVAVGDEFIDLNEIERGVQYAVSDSRRLTDVLPRKAVQENTWRKIVVNLTARRLLAQPPAPPPPRQ